MKGNSVEVLDSLLGEVNELRRKSELLEVILRYYDMEQKTFNIPEKTPKQFIYNKIIELLPQDEVDHPYMKF